MLQLSSCAACFNYLVAEGYPNPKNIWIGASIEDFHERSLRLRYVTSIYWSITTLAIVGYGDLHKGDALLQYVVGQANTGDIVGEIGVLCYKPHSLSERRD
ncbi:hypothetical protein LIER_10990 [Lithospermum erythrorhizon]|uniref:Potassium channel domain-containing protein n=1 Tax=Lithospermum erythrorhizon TaxID=34254 RepID=A0AAV3PLE7_LITER